MLLEVGFEKKISFFNVDCITEQYHDALFNAFPKLKEAGGFEMM